GFVKKNTRGVTNSEHGLNGIRTIFEVSEFSTEALAEVFSRMKFRVVMCKDKTAVEIPIVLKVFSELKQLSDLQQCGAKEWVGGQFTDLKDLPKHGDAFVCCILSHGIKEGVCATDGTVVPTIDILSPFNGEKCTILVGKPKVFFIQAYRGVPVPKRNPVEDKELRADYDQVQNYTLPIWSDFLVVMAIRNKTKGSWFFQSLCGQLKDVFSSSIYTQYPIKVFKHFCKNIYKKTYFCHYRVFYFFLNALYIYIPDSDIVRSNISIFLNSFLFRICVYCFVLVLLHRWS
uniref:Caspase family p20 domain-containing protein n=1 Tax=Salmo trutta TaxID=8032 RepID=A0A673XJW7_SALTR